MTRWQARKTYIVRALADVMSPEDHDKVVKALEGHPPVGQQYGDNVGDVGSHTPFLEEKFGSVLRLNPPAWELLAPHSTVVGEAYGVSLDFRQSYVGTRQVQNMYTDEH